MLDVFTNAVAEWIRGLESEMRLSAGTLTKYRQIASEHAAACLRAGAVSWADVSRESILRDMSGSTGHRNTARLRLTALRSLHRWLAETRHAPQDASAGIRTPRVPDRRLNVLTRAEVGALLRACEGTAPEDLRDRALLEVAYSTGCRAGELQAMLVDDLDLSAGTILLRGKGGRHRLGVLGAPAAQAVRVYIQHGRASLDGDPTQRHLFLSRLRRPFTNMGLWQLLNRRAKRAQLARRIHPHMLRHAFAVHCAQSGMDTRTLQLLLGHASIQTVQAYLHYADTHPQAEHRRHHPRG